MSKSALYTLIAFISMIRALSAQQSITFIGEDQNNPHKWHEDDNWSCGCLPSGGDTIIINGDSVSITTVDPEPDHIILRDSAVLLNRRSITLATAHEFSILADSGSIIHNEGIISIEDASPWMFDQAIRMNAFSRLFNDGLVRIEIPQCVGIRMNTSSKLVNNGTIYIETTNQGIVFGNADIQNFDSIFIEGGIAIQASGSTPTFLNGVSGRMDLKGDICIFIQGSLTNFGKIKTRSNEVHWRVRPGGVVNHLDGLITTENLSFGGFGAAAIDINSGGSFLVSEDAVFIVEETSQRPLFELELGATLDFQGIVEIGVGN